MACDLDGSKIGSEAHQRINESRDRRISASAHQLIGAQVWLGAHVTDGVLPLQASVVEHSDQSRKTVTPSSFLKEQFCTRRNFPGDPDFSTTESGEVTK